MDSHPSRFSLVARILANLPAASSSLRAFRLAGAGAAILGASLALAGPGLLAEAAAMTLSASANPVTYGQALTLTASGIASGATGKVSFMDGGRTLGTGAVSGGKATLAIAAGSTALAAGSQSLTASYGGDARHAPATSRTLTLVVDPATPAFSGLLAAPASPTLNAPVTFTATLAGAGEVPTGTVRFSIGGSALGTGTLSAGTTSVTAPMTALGSNSVTATYTPGDPNYVAVSRTLAVTVGLDSASVTLAANPAPPVTGQAVTFTATVAAVAPATGTPTGTVTFTVAGGSSSPPVALSGGTASYSTAFGAGTQTVTATYSGDSHFSPASASPLAQAVGQGASAITLAASGNASACSLPVTFSATVAAVAPAAGTPTGGPVIFYDGAIPLGTATLANGKATLTSAALPQGGNTLTAIYGGDADFAASAPSRQVSLTVVSSLSDLAGVPSGFGNLDGTGSAARFDEPYGVAVNTSTGNIYMSDSINEVIRMITPAGVVTTFAGIPGVAGSADGGPGQASFHGPSGVAVNSANGNVYVADATNSTIRMITADGTVSTLAGTAGVYGSTDSASGTPSFNSPCGVACDPATGNVYVADSNNDTIRMITPAGVVTTVAGTPDQPGNLNGQGSAARFCIPMGVAFDPATGNLYVADMYNNAIRMLTPPSAQSPGWTVSSLPWPAQGRPYTFPQGVAVDGSGNLYVADTFNGVVDLVTNPGTHPVASTLAGTADRFGSADGPALSASFIFPTGLAADANDNIYVAPEGDDTLRLITQPTPTMTAMVSTVAGARSYPGSAGGTGTGARFSGPEGLAADGQGNVYVADTGNSVICMIAPGGGVTTLAGSAGNYGFQDGPGSAASFSNPSSVALDSAGDVYVADTWNNAIRLITPGGTVSTLAGSSAMTGSQDGPVLSATFNGPEGVAVDPAGNVYVADTGNATIRMIQNGQVSTIAGAPGSGTQGLFDAPAAIAVDPSGTLYVADPGNDTISRITPPNAATSAWNVATLAGTAGSPGSADGAGAAAGFNNPTALAVDANGNLYVADQGNHTVRLVSPSGVVSTMLGVAGSAGTVPGPVPALLYSPSGIAVSPLNGNVYVSVPDAVLEQAAVAFPCTPVITTLPCVTAGGAGSASAPAQNGFTLGWSISNGTLTGTSADGTVLSPTTATGSSITYTAGPSGTVQLTCAPSAGGNAYPGNQGTAACAIVAPPSIISIATSVEGGTTLLVPYFSTDGEGLATAVLNPGNHDVIDGQGIVISQAATTTYTLTVTNSAGSLVTHSVTVTGAR